MNDFTGFTFEHYPVRLSRYTSDDHCIEYPYAGIFIRPFSNSADRHVRCDGDLLYEKRRTRTALLSLNNVLLVSPDVIIGASFSDFLHDDRKFVPRL